jgi:hypothetical protein
MGQSQGANPLDYAPPPPGFRTTRAYRWLVISAVFLVIIAVLIGLVLSVEVASKMLDNFQLQRQVRQCIAHPMPQGVLIYTSDNPAATIDSPQELAMEQTELKIKGGPMRYSMDPAINSASMTWATVFMGELQTRGGRRSFVHIEAGMTADARGNTRIQLEARFISPDGTMGSCSSDMSYSDEKLRPAVMLYSATRDPDDPSHISFRYCTFSETHEVDSYLNAMGFNWTDRKVGP